jgi:ribonuclease-3
LPDWSLLEKRIGVKFRSKSLLQQSLVHRSYLNEVPESGFDSNERLEFLGDAVLGLVVAGKLYADYPDRPEGQLTELRAAVVRRDTLAKVAKRLTLGEYLYLGKGEESAGGRNRPSNLSAAYEAVVGAVYLDGGIDKARRFVIRSLSPEFEALPKGRIPGDPKSRLQEILQARYQRPPIYRVVHDEGPDHSKIFTVQVSAGRKVLGTGQGKSKQQAEKEAAARALDSLEGRSSRRSASKRRS